MTNKRDSGSSSHHQSHTTHSENRGFASMPEEQVRDIASKGGHARAEQAGHEGMAEMGRKGGRASHGGSSSSSSSGGKAARRSKEEKDR